MDPRLPHSRYCSSKQRVLRAGWREEECFVDAWLLSQPEELTVNDTGAMKGWHSGQR